jgi:flagellar hook-length control protein FliK
MASNLTVVASAQTSRSTDPRSSVAMGAEPAAGQTFAKTLEREVNSRQEGKSADSDKPTPATKEENTSEDEQKAQASSAQAAQPWLAMLQVQALAQASTLTNVAKPDNDKSFVGLDLTKLGKGLLSGEDGEGKDLTVLGQSDLNPSQALAGDIDAAKFASLRQKAAGDASAFTAPEEDFAALLAVSKENTLLLKTEAAPVVALHTPVADAKPAVPTHTVAEPVGSSRWGDAVAQRVSMMLQDKHQQIDMQLNPPHLGPMEVRLTMSGEQASVVFSSQHASVREALAAATPRLTMLLADQGIQLSNVQVASDSLNQHAQQQAQQQASSQQMDQQHQSRSRQFAGNLTDNYSDGLPRVMTDVHLPVARSGLNLYV